MSLFIPEVKGVFPHPSCTGLSVLIASSPRPPSSAFDSFYSAEEMQGRIWTKFQASLVVAALPPLPACTSRMLSHDSPLSFGECPLGQCRRACVMYPYVCDSQDSNVSFVHTWPLPASSLVISAESFSLGLVRQPQVRKYSHPIPAHHHLSALDLIRYSWLVG